MKKSFLVIQTAFIGDVILGTCVVEKLHRFFPDAHIDVLVRKGNESLFEAHPFVHEVMVWDKRTDKLKNLFAIIKKVREKRYQHVVNLHRFASSGFICMFSKAEDISGFDKNPLSFFFTRKQKHIITEKPGKQFFHEVQRDLQLVEYLTDESFQAPKLYPSREQFKKISVYTTDEFITVSPASVWFTKQTPESVWIDLLNRIDTKVYLLGGPGDITLCERIAKGSKHTQVEVLAGKLSLLESAALMSKARMNFTNDSAPMHLCSAMNAPVTAVYCSTIPEFGFGPLSDTSFIVQNRESLTCKPCGLHGYKACPQRHFSCAQIPIEELVESAQHKAS
jgi:heptosyltransferase-2